MKFILIFVMLLSSCESGVCNYANSTDANAPLLLNIDFIGQAAADPWRIILALDFVDLDGDLSAGTALFSTNYDPQPVAELPLAPIFAASGGLDMAATSGRLAVPLVINNTTTTQSTALHLSIQVQDGQSHASNCVGHYFMVKRQP